jgi:hypothetical protein
MKSQSMLKMPLPAFIESNMLSCFLFCASASTIVSLVEIKTAAQYEHGLVWLYWVANSHHHCSFFCHSVTSKIQSQCYNPHDNWCASFFSTRWVKVHGKDSKPQKAKCAHTLFWEPYHPFQTLSSAPRGQQCNLFCKSVTPVAGL